MQEVVAKIEALSRKPGFIYTLALILLRDLFFAPEEAAEVNWHEHLSFKELAFLIGLIIKNELDLSIPNEDDVQEWFKAIDVLFGELHEKHYEVFREKLAARLKDQHPSTNPEREYREMFGAGHMMTEPIFYSDSGAYDFQCLEFAVRKYKKDSQWITQHVGVDVPLMALAARELKKLHEDKFHLRPWAGAQNFSELCRAVLSIFCFTEPELHKTCGPEAAKRFIDAFSLVPGTVNHSLKHPGQYNALHSRPIVRLPSGCFFLPVNFILSEAIYEAPFYWMNEDAAYKQTALRNRGESAQDIAARLLKPVFGEGNVYTEVRIEKAKGQTLTDIDVLAIAGNKAVIVQVKSKRLTELARVGDSERLTADFKAAVQDAYDQGLISRQAVIDRSTKFLAGDKELRLTEGIDDAYILCLTLDHYPAITHQVDVYLNKSKTDPFPVALSVFDLDILAFYLGDPFDFLYYLRQRVRLSPYFKADSEMSLLGFHIKHKLHKSSDVDMEALDQSFAQLIDANFPVLRGSVPKTAAAEKLYPEWKNDEFQGLVRQTKAAASAGFTDAVFFLYDLAGEAADGLIECIKKLKRKSATDHRAHDASLLIAEGRAGISIVIEPSSSSTMRRKLYSLCVLRKHKSKADTWLGLGSLTVSNTLVDSMIFNNDPWQEDPQLNRLADAHLGRTGRARTASGTKIGRNDPCPCGSGNKFKRCHGA